MKDMEDGLLHKNPDIIFVSVCNTHHENPWSGTIRIMSITFLVSLNTTRSN